MARKKARRTRLEIEADARRTGRPPEREGTRCNVYMSIRLSSDVVSALRVEAKKRDTKPATLARAFVLEGLDRAKRKGGRK